MGNSMTSQAIATNDPAERVRMLAHRIWEEEGRPDGRADAHWLKAEELVKTEAPKPAKKKAAPRASTLKS